MSRCEPSVYVAGPLFSAAERDWNTRVKIFLTPHANIYLPQEDGGLLIDMIAEGIPASNAMHCVFDRDIQALISCDILLLLMDGRSLDEGACFELGYAFALGKICAGLRTDSRQLLAIGNNPMIECSLSATFSTLDAVAEWISGGHWCAVDKSRPRFAPPPR